MLRKTAFALVPTAFLSLSGFLAADDSEFWKPECDSLPGSRTHCNYGKRWPLAPRPNCNSEPAIHRYHTSHYWPDPYRWQDRSSVNAAIDIQRSAGWMTATTLYEQHFDPTTQELNQAGRIHLHWIMLHIPQARRIPWVQAGDNLEISRARLASVQNEIAAIGGAGASTPMLRVCQAYGGSAEEVDLVRRAYRTSMPAPRISGGASSGGDPTTAGK